MTTPMDDTLTAIGRQLSITYLPTVLEPLPRELNDLVARLVAFEMRKRESSARPSETLKLVMAQLVPERTDSVCSLGGSLAMQGPARTVKTTAGTVQARGPLRYYVSGRAR